MAGTIAGGALVDMEVRESIALVTLRNSRKRNVLSRETLGELRDTLAALAASQEAKCILVRAEGPVFSAGHDLRELLAADRDELVTLFELCTQVMEQIRLAPQPVIAEVAGLATAAGCQLVATCDLVVASTDAAFATPGVRIGLFCSTPAVAVARAVPTKKAMEMLLTGRPISATEAERIGLVNRVVPPEHLHAEAWQLARTIVEASPEVVSLGKRAFYEQLPLAREHAYRLAQKVMVDNAQLADAREGMQAFLDKRTPHWSRG
jgi:enoyl-CoA hydratase/carnithine racemase